MSSNERISIKYRSWRYSYSAFNEWSSHLKNASRYSSFARKTYHYHQDEDQKCVASESCYKSIYNVCRY